MSRDRRVHPYNIASKFEVREVKPTKRYIVVTTNGPSAIHTELSGINAYLENHNSQDYPSRGDEDGEI